MDSKIDFDPVGEELKRLASKRSVVVNTSSLPVYDAPDCNKIGVISDGYVVKELRQNDGWTFIVWGDYLNKTGFVESKYLIDIDERSKIPATINGKGLMA